MSQVALVGPDPEIAELIAAMGEHSMVGLFDPDPAARCLDLPRLGPDAAWDEVRQRLPELRLVMALDPPALKTKLARHYGMERFVSIVAPEAQVSPRARIGPGSVIQRGVRLLPDVRIGRLCKLNLDAAVHHDSVVGDCCTLAPGCRLLGNVVLAEALFVGAHAVVLPRCRIGAGATIGAGAVVVEDVAAGAVVTGVPARPRATARGGKT